MRSDLSEHKICVQKGTKNHIKKYFKYFFIFELYEHINYFPIAQIYKLFLGISYVFLMSIVNKHLE
jgi:hypothetical protein